jgi:hypothetical protein
LCEASSLTAPFAFIKISQVEAPALCLTTIISKPFSNTARYNSFLF